MAQFGAIMRFLGVRFGFYNIRDWKTASYCDPIVETWGDVMGAAAGVLFAPDDDTRAVATEKLMEVCVKYNGLIEKTMTHHGGSFAAGNRMTIADFVLASYCGNFIRNSNNPIHAGIQEKLADTPKFKAYCDAVESTFPYLVERGPIESPM